MPDYSRRCPECTRLIGLSGDQVTRETFEQWFEQHDCAQGIVGHLGNPSVSCAEGHSGILRCPSVQWVCPLCDAKLQTLSQTPEEARASHETKCPNNGRARGDLSHLSFCPEDSYLGN